MAEPVFTEGGARGWWRRTKPGEPATQCTLWTRRHAHGDALRTAASLSLLPALLVGGACGGIFALVYALLSSCSCNRLLTHIQHHLPQGRTSLDKAPPVHFYTAVGGNMSTVLPNGLFDVMLDAQESGELMGGWWCAVCCVKDKGVSVLSCLFCFLRPLPRCSLSILARVSPPQVE